MTKKQRAAADLMRLIAESRKAWAVGDACASAHRGYRNPNTTIVQIAPAVRPMNDRDLIATLADGSSCHISKVRSPKENV